MHGTFIPPVKRGRFAYNRARYLRLMNGFKCPLPAVRRICARVMWKHDVPWAKILSPLRRVHVSHARQELMWAMANAFPDWSYPQLGRFFKRDHTTVHHGVHKFAGLILDGRVSKDERLTISEMKRANRKQDTLEQRRRRDHKIMGFYEMGWGPVEISRELRVPYAVVYQILVRTLGHNPLTVRARK